jgi:hypothetical protein
MATADAAKQGDVSAERSPGERPRIIATTDGEIDDRCSMVRFLLYANEWDIDGIIYCSSKFHWKGHNWAGEQWIERDIDLYAEFYDTLKQHAPGFPTPQQLKDLTFIGNIDNVGEMEKETPGSDHIVKILLDSKPGPVYLQAWGGTNTIARALKTIQEKHPDQTKKVSDKAILYIILDQDDTLNEYVLPNWPGVQVLGSFRQFAGVAYKCDELMPPEPGEIFKGPWMKENILEGHGPLCARYECHKGDRDGDFRSEGDSPSFMHQIDVGLRSLEHPSHGGWGGRFERDERGECVWRGAKDDGDLFKPLWRWAEAFQNDWAARADWCVKKYDEANHPPAVTLAHELDLKAKAGDTVKLSAKGTKDPDGDALVYKWWQYKEPGTCKGAVAIQDADQPEASFVVPDDAGTGETVHIICEVTDSGDPPLTRYRRVIVEVSKE